MNKFVLILFLISILSDNLFAQQTHSGWTAVFNTAKLSKRTSLISDVQLRSTDEWQHVQTLLIRSGLNYSLTKKLGITVGYAYVSNRRSLNGITDYLPEHRAWEQLLFNHKLSRIQVSHRLRFEQRFISNAVAAGQHLETDGYSFAQRARYFIRNIIPLKNGPAFERGIFGAIQNEVFLNFGNKAAVNDKTFDQNRLYLAAGFRFGKRFDLEAGYMYQYVVGRGEATINNNILQLAGYLRL